MSKKYVYIVMVPLILLSLVLVAYSSPTVTWIRPTTGGTGNALSGIYGLNLSINSDDYHNITNVTLYLQSNTTWVNVNASGLVTQIVGQDCKGEQPNHNCTSFNISLNTATLQDDVRYTLMVAIHNESSMVNDSTNTLTNLYVDNNDGVCSQSTLSSNTKYDKSSTTLSITGTNMSTSIVKFGGNTYYPTEGGGSDKKSDTFTLSLATIPDSIYEVTIQTGDSIDITSCPILTGVQLESSGTGTGGGGASITATGGVTAVSGTTDGAETFSIIPPSGTGIQGYIPLILIGAVIYFVVFGGKKKRK